jgi:hypothetical protein
VVITGRDSLPLRRRLQALGITHVHYGTEDKRPAAEQTLQALGLDWSQAAAIGDDWPDLPVLRRCAFACAPANAHPEALACALCHPAARRRRGRARVLRPAAGGQRPLRRPAAGRRLMSSATCRGASRPWAGALLLDHLSIYLPVILMGVLALGTYWLVRTTPVFRRPQQAPRHEPDYFMRDFAVKTFDRRAA